MEKAVAKIGELGINSYIVGCKSIWLINLSIIVQELIVT